MVGASTVETAAFVAAVTRGDRAAAERALAGNSSLARARNDAGISVVCLAVYAGQRELATELAARREDLDVFEASCLGATERVRELVRRDPELVEALSPDGFRPLGYGAFFGHLELVRFLLASGASVERPSENPMRVRPLHSAVAHLDPSLAPRLAAPLLEAGADPNARQQGGFTPLHEAAHNGTVELIRLLLRHGARVELCNDAGATPRELALEQGHDEAAFLLKPQREPDLDSAGVYLGLGLDDLGYGSLASRARSGAAEERRS